MQDEPAETRTQRWLICRPDEEAARSLATALQCPPAIARLLVSRGLRDVEGANRFLHPGYDELLDPAGMLGMAAAVERIERAVRQGEKILIYGDYDVDGTVATVLLKTAIERIAARDQPAQVTYHVPHRLREGYGIQNSRLGVAAADGIALVISVDTGIRAFEAADEAKALGLDLIVTDHHLPDGVTGVPEALAVINPAQAGCGYANKSLCGAGVAFKLAHALLRAAARTPEELDRLNRVLIPSFLKLVAIATVADSVALMGENRAIVSLGLRELRNPVQAGLRALMQVAEIPLDRAPTASEVGFRIAPRINAAGRMDIASDVVELFLTRDAAVALALARKLDDLNQVRRATEAAALEAIDLQLLTLRAGSGQYPAECLVLGHPEWHRGVLGILASRVVERTGRPAIIMTEEDGDAHGSGRSVDGYHLLHALEAAHSGDSLFSRFGGHAHAVGFSLLSSRVADLRQRIQAHSAARLTEEMLLPEQACDLELHPSEITAELIPWLELCAPYGMENPEPVFVTRGMILGGSIRVIKERHVCIPVCAPDSPAGTAPLNAMGWSRSNAVTPDWPSRCAALKLSEGARIDLVYRMRENKHPRYGGLELELLDLAPAATEPASLDATLAEQKAAPF